MPITKSQRTEILAKYEYLSQVTRVEGFLWEFVRRNKEYKDLYQRFLQDRSAMHKPFYDPPMINEDGGHPFKWADRTGRAGFPELFLALKKFGLVFPIDPEKRADDEYFVMRDPSSVFFWKEMFGPIACFFPSRLHVESEIRRKEWREEHPMGIELMVDVSAPYKLIQERVMKLVKLMRKNLLKVSTTEKKYTPKKKVRYRKEDWIHFLIAYDLRDKRFPLRDISYVLYATNPNKHSVNVKQDIKGLNKCLPDCAPCKKIRHHLKTAKELINGRYREFFFIK